MRRICLSLAALLATSVPSLAINRYDSTTMSCDKARSLVASQGAVIFRYPSKNTPGLTLYDRYVKHGGLCPIGQVTAPQSIPVAGGAACRLLRCVSAPDDDGMAFPGRAVET